MDNLKTGIGFILMAIGICVGLYVGLWVFFIGGVVDVVEAVRADVLVELDLAIGVLKVVFASFAGSISGGVFFFAGQSLIED